MRAHAPRIAHPRAGTRGDEFASRGNPPFGPESTGRSISPPSSGTVDDETFAYSQDDELWGRLLRHTRAANIAEPLVASRVHDLSTSSRQRGEQQEIATRVARQHLAHLGFDVSREDVVTLRHWFYRFPRSVSADEVCLCALLLQVLTAFGNQHGLEAPVFTRIQRHWVSRVLGASPMRHWLDIARLGDVAPGPLAHAVLCRVARRLRP